MVFEAIPENAPEDALVLRVEFDRADVLRLVGPRPTSPANEWLLMNRIAVDAQVVEVVRGEYDNSTVRVAIGGSSCDSPFIFGRRGLIIGEFVSPDAGQAQYDAWAQAQQAPEWLRLRWPFRETVFVPITENRDDRQERRRR